MMRRMITLSYVFITVITLLFLAGYGMHYYSLPIEQRFFDEQDQELKPSGVAGHGFGIVGSIMMIVGVTSYMVRKRSRRLIRVGKLKYWLEFHIFLCSLGPILILFHTAFKFGGIVAISFWSMVAVVLSGVVGRFIYNQIPRSIQGRELSLGEVVTLKAEIASQLHHLPSGMSDQIEIILNTNTVQKTNLLSEYFHDWNKSRQVKDLLKSRNIMTGKEDVLNLVKMELSLKRKLKRLVTMQSWFRSWHIIHLPFALIMMIIMVVHIVITITFGYRWIF